MVNIEEIRKQRKKKVVSMFLNSENVRILKEDLQKESKGLSISGLFDSILQEIVDTIKKKEEEKKENETKAG
jgi:hypothetical protein